MNLVATIIDKVKSGKGQSYEVKWNQSNRDIYVSYAGWSHVGKASSARDAMNKAGYQRKAGQPVNSTS